MFNRKIKLQFNKVKYSPLLMDSNLDYKFRVLFTYTLYSKGKCY